MQFGFSFLVLLGVISYALPAKTSAAESSRIHLSVDASGKCTGLQIGQKIIPWVAVLGIVEDKSSTKYHSRSREIEQTDEFVEDGIGLRWTQQLRNITHRPIGVGPNFAVRPESGTRWKASGIPLDVRLFSNEKVGVSLILHPNEAIWEGSRRLNPQDSITFTALVRIHEADWRPALAAFASAYPEFINPPNPRVHQVAGGGAYSSSEEVPELEKSLRMGFRVNWKASFDFTGLGVFVAPSPKSIDMSWKDIRGRNTSIRQMADYAHAMRESGFHVLNYFNITEVGHKIAIDPPRRTLDDGELWRSPNEWIHYGIREAILNDLMGHPLYSNWEGCVVADSGEPNYHQHLLDQAARLANDFPDADGVCVDRMDHLSKVNLRRDDGLSFIPGYSSGAKLLVSWMQTMEEIGPIFHKANKVLFGNPIKQYSLAAFRHLDGIYTEFWDELEACALLCIRKPLIVWSGPYDDYAMQKLLHYGGWPTCSMPGNDHCQGPDPKVEATLADYAPLFDALHGRRWALHPHPISATDLPDAQVNLFQIPGGYLATMTQGGEATQATLRLPNLPIPHGAKKLKAWCIQPGNKWSSVPLQEQGSDWTVTLPLSRGCGVVRIHWLWVEPFQRWGKNKLTIEAHTTIAGAEIRATLNETEVQADSPLWQNQQVENGTLRVRTAAWIGGRKLDDDIDLEFIGIP